MTTAKLARIIAVLSSVLIVACRNESPSEPTCRVDRDSAENISGNAVCVVRVEELMLSIRAKGADKLQLPNGINQEQESAQCTAHRATWEFTGFNVEVGRFIQEDKQGLRFYHCILDAGFNGDITDFPIPRWAKDKTSQVLLVDPFATTASEWHQADELIFVRELFNATNYALP